MRRREGADADFFLILLFFFVSRRYTRPGNTKRPLLLLFFIFVFMSLTGISMVHNWHPAVSATFFVFTLLASAPFFFMTQNELGDAVTKTFRVPLAPLIPLLGVYINIYFMVNLPVVCCWLSFSFVAACFLSFANAPSHPTSPPFLPSSFFSRLCFSSAFCR